MRLHSPFSQMIAVVALSGCVFACVVVPMEIRTGPSFAVHVSNELGPVVGLKIAVTGFLQADDVVATAITDKNGDAHFHLQAVGTFDLEIDHPVGTVDLRRLTVTQDALPANVDLKWPDRQFLKTKLVNGTIATELMAGGRTTGPVQSAELTLHDWISYKQIAEVETATDGSFRFGEVPAGLYFLQVKSKTDRPYDPNGAIPILVNPSAPRDSLAILISQTDCGLMYNLEENKAKYKPEFCMMGSGQRVPCPGHSDD